MENAFLEDLPHHPSTEVRHVGLVEGDLGPARDALGVLT